MCVCVCVFVHVCVCVCVGRPHLSVRAAIAALAGRAGPVALAAVVAVVMRVVLALRAVSLLVHGGGVVVVVVMVVPTVLGTASLALTLLGRQVARLRGGAQVCAQALGGKAVTNATYITNVT